MMMLHHDHDHEDEGEDDEVENNKKFNFVDFFTT